jgi:hypothetical protein
MGVSRSPAELAGKLASAASAIGDTKIPLTATAQAVKGDFVSSLRDVGVHGTTKVSKAVKARYDIKGDTALVKYTGPAHLLDRPTRAHSLVSRKNRGTRRGRGSRTSGVGARGAILVNGSPKAFAMHPGTKGLHFFARARNKAEQTAPRVYQREGVLEPLRRIF